MKKFNDIEDVLNYLFDNIDGKNVKYSSELLMKVKNLLMKFPHNPRIKNPEVKDYNATEGLRMHRQRRPNNPVVNSNAIMMVLFNFDEDLVYYVTFGDINMNGVFDFEEVDVVPIKSVIKSNDEAYNLLEEYYKEVEYDEMNDSVNYHSVYQSMKERKTVRRSEIVEIFNDYEF